MGKSEKKIKSERINALKKKYDTLLEEDKKRKERNEYILEKLDKMRSCTAVVPFGNNQNVYEDNRKGTFVNTSKPTLDNNPVTHSSLQQRYCHLDLPDKYADESKLLLEISKKYIVIPKLGALYSNESIEPTKPVIDENSDWKSKYDILNQIKQNEKDEPPTRDYSVKTAEDSLKNVVNVDLIPQRDNEPLPNYKYDLPEYVQTDIVSSYRQSNDQFNQNISKYKNPLNNTNGQKNAQSVMQEVPVAIEPELLGSDIGCKELQDAMNYNTAITTEHETPDEFNSNKLEQIQNFIDPTNNVIFNECEAEIKTGIQDTQNEKDVDTNYVNTDQDNEIQAVNATDFDNELNNDSKILDNTEFNDNTAYLNEAVSHDFVNPREETQLGDESYLGNENQDVTNESNIVAVSEDHNEPDSNPNDPIIVTENTDLIAMTKADDYSTENAEYYNTGEQNYNYNQGVADNYREYTEQQNQDNYTGYYEGTQGEQPYVQDTNANEESMQRYDPNYEQQYNTAYDQQQYQQQEYDQQYTDQNYLQNQYLEQGDTLAHGQQEQVEYENQDIAPQYAEQADTLIYDQQETIQYQNQDITPQYVEQLLDSEEGYVEKINEEVNSGNVENPSINQNVPIETDQQVKA